jgi:hypothetical protein
MHTVTPSVSLMKSYGPVVANYAPVMSRYEPL